MQTRPTPTPPLWMYSIASIHPSTYLCDSYHDHVCIYSSMYGRSTAPHGSSHITAAATTTTGVATGAATAAAASGVAGGASGGVHSVHIKHSTSTVPPSRLFKLDVNPIMR